MSTRPAAILGLAKGQLEPGFDADFVLVDLDTPYTVEKEKLHSKSCLLYTSLAGNTRPEWGCEKNTHEKAILSCNRSKKMIRYSYINICLLDTSSAALSFCPTAPARPSAFALLLRAPQLLLPRLLALISLAMTS